MLEGQVHEVAGFLERIHGSEERRRWNDELALGQVQPPSCGRDARAELSIRPEDLVPQEEAAAVRCMAASA